MFFLNTLLTFNLSTRYLNYKTTTVVSKASHTKGLVRQRGLQSCVCIPHAELAARRNVERATNPAIAYEPLLQAGIIIFIHFN